jgi:hypothetical protein
VEWGAWASSIRLRIGTGGGLLWNAVITFGFHKMRVISWVAEDSMELVRRKKDWKWGIKFHPSTILQLVYWFKNRDCLKLRNTFGVSRSLSPLYEIGKFCIDVCMYVCMNVWIYVCIYVLMIGYIFIFIYVCLFIYVCVFVYILWIYVCVYICIYITFLRNDIDYNIL